MLQKFECQPLGFLKLKRQTVCGIALAIFAAGSLFAIPLTPLGLVNQAKADNSTADSDRIFELRVYHVLPGRMAALEERFRDTTSKLLAKHDLNVVGYWVAADTVALDDRFIFLVAHRSKDEAKTNWDAMKADPAFQETVKSEQADKTVGKVDVTYMDPADFSPMK